MVLLMMMMALMPHHLSPVVIKCAVLCRQLPSVMQCDCTTEFGRQIVRESARCRCEGATIDEDCSSGHARTRRQSERLESETSSKNVEQRAVVPTRDRRFRNGTNGHTFVHDRDDVIKDNVRSDIDVHHTRTNRLIQFLVTRDCLEGCQRKTFVQGEKQRQVAARPSSGRRHQRARTAVLTPPLSSGRRYQRTCAMVLTPPSSSGGRYQ